MEGPLPTGEGDGDVSRETMVCVSARTLGADRRRAVDESSDCKWDTAGDHGGARAVKGSREQPTTCGGV